MEKSGVLAAPGAANHAELTPVTRACPGMVFITGNNL